MQAPLTASTWFPVRCPPPALDGASTTWRRLVRDLLEHGSDARSRSRRGLSRPPATASLGANKTIQPLLQSGMLEIDLELVPFLRDDLSVTELAVEHALAEFEVRA